MGNLGMGVRLRSHRVKVPRRVDHHDGPVAIVVRYGVWDQTKREVCVCVCACACACMGA